MLSLFQTLKRFVSFSSILSRQVLNESKVTISMIALTAIYCIEKFVNTNIKTIKK